MSLGNLNRNEYGTLPQKIEQSEVFDVVNDERDQRHLGLENFGGRGMVETDNVLTHHDHTDADYGINPKLPSLRQKPILYCCFAASICFLSLFPFIHRQQYHTKKTILTNDATTEALTPRIGRNGVLDNDDTKFETLPWEYKTDPETGQSFYLGYLVFCSDGNDKYGYRSATSLLSSSSSSSNFSSSSSSCYQAGVASPLIRMIPGKHYRLILINRAHVRTNLHTHGLHVAGVDGVDDITRSVDPGNCLVYHYHILDDADVGTFWYHSHRHPISALQVGGGAYGLLIVDETKENMEQYPKHLQRFFQTKEVTLQFFSVLDKTNKPYKRTSKVNGKEDPLRIYMGQNEYYYFRVSAVVVTDPLSYIEFIPSNACESRVVAYDGVYRSKIPHEHISSKHSLTLSSRVDLAVKCNSKATLMFHHGKVTDGLNVTIETIKTSTVDDRTTNSSSSNIGMASPFWNLESQSQWNPRRPYYMPNLLAEENVIDDIWNVTMDNIKKKGKKMVSINHHVWDVNKSIRTFELHQLIEFNLFKTKKHPFHIHINRMQIVEPGGCGLRYEEGEYFDSIASAKKKCSVRVQFFDFAGRVIAHCHKLKHEDRGMMVWIEITGGPEHGVQGDPQLACDTNLLLKQKGN